MLNYGQALLDKNYATFPAKLPLLVYHGDEDPITYHEASKEFVEKVKADDKEFKSYKGYFHELHNEVRSRSLPLRSGWIRLTCYY